MDGTIMLFLVGLCAIVFFLIMISVDASSATNSASKEKSPFVKRSLLNENEADFYEKLKPLAEQYRLRVLMKVNMSDIIELRSDLSEEKKNELAPKIKSQKIDFALISDINIQLLIDYTENTEETFKQKILEKAGYVYIRTNGKTGRIKDFLSDNFPKVS